MNEPSPSPEIERVKALLRMHARAMTVAGAATLAAILGVYIAACLIQASAKGGSSGAMGLLASLAIGTIVVAVAGPLVAASGRGVWAVVLRAGAVADGAGVALLAIWVAGLLGLGPGITFAAACKVDCVYIVMVLAGSAAVCVARSPVARHAVAVASAAVLLLAVASPFWVNGLIERAKDKDSRQTVVDLAVESNPFYSVSAAVMDQTNLVWHQAPVLYNLTRIGEYTAPSPVEWYAFVLRCGLVGVFFIAVAIVRWKVIGPAGNGD